MNKFFDMHLSPLAAAMHAAGVTASIDMRPQKTSISETVASALPELRVVASGDAWVRNSEKIRKNPLQQRKDYAEAAAKRARKQMQRMQDAGMNTEDLL